MLELKKNASKYSNLFFEITFNTPLSLHDRNKCIYSHSIHQGQISDTIEERGRIFQVVVT